MTWHRYCTVGTTCNCTLASTVERPRANASEPVPQDDEQQHFWVSEHARKTSGRAPDSAWRSVGHDADVTSCSHMSGFEVFPGVVGGKFILRWFRRAKIDPDS